MSLAWALAASGCGDAPFVPPPSDTGYCPADRRVCGGRCVNPSADPLHCGTCENRCPDGAACVSGACVGGCPASRTTCASACVDAQSDADHCGGCGRACGASEACVGGACASTCAAPRMLCNGACVDRQTDANHCGQCNRACGDGAVCASGVCQPVIAGVCALRRECGEDGAGGTCGFCPTDRPVCNTGGRCVSSACETGCAGRECGPDPGTNCAGATCGRCASGAACNAAGRCVCTPNCFGRVCGDDGCGGRCGECAAGSLCNGVGVCEQSSSGTCASGCGSRRCGADPGIGCAGRTCGECAQGSRCADEGARCAIDDSARWVLRVVDATVSRTDAAGRGWDEEELPDPMVCATYADGEHCTASADNTTTARWDLDLPAVTTRALTNDGVQFTVWDVDPGPDQTICRGLTRWTAEQVLSHRGQIDCGALATVHVEFRPE